MHHVWSELSDNSRKPFIAVAFRPLDGQNLAKHGLEIEFFLQARLISLYTTFDVVLEISIRNRDRKVPITVISRRPEGRNLAVRCCLKKCDRQTGQTYRLVAGRTKGQTYIEYFRAIRCYTARFNEGFHSELEEFYNQKPVSLFNIYQSYKLIWKYKCIWLIALINCLDFFRCV